MKRIYRPYWEWEDFDHGMWDRICGEEGRAMLQEAISFTGNAPLYGSFMRRVIKEWPRSCEHNLTEESMNRLAWIGHAATCLAIGCPESTTRMAWAYLTQRQQDEANAEAEAALQTWCIEHEKKDSQLCLFLEAQGIPGRDTGRSTGLFGGKEQGP